MPSNRKHAATTAAISNPSMMRLLNLSQFEVLTIVVSSQRRPRSGDEAIECGPPCISHGVDAGITGRRPAAFPVARRLHAGDARIERSAQGSVRRVLDVSAYIATTRAHGYVMNILLTTLGAYATTPKSRS